VVGKDKPLFHASHHISAIMLAANVIGVTVPNSGHWIPEEQPEFLVNQLSNFFGRNNATTTTTDSMYEVIHI
jgi:pimeloyl-ACP methyl ester carboxylesterase